MRIAIVGLGLIGGSIGLSLKQSNPTVEIIGYARRLDRIGIALKSGIIDRGETNLNNAVKKADIIVIATPVLTIKDILRQLAKSAPQGCLITDTASTKSQVMEWARELLPSTMNFIGGHPMAGKETCGMEAAESGLFRGSIYCLTSWENASAGAVNTLVRLVELLGASPFFIDAKEHDEIVAGISHLPMLLSAALVSTTAYSPFWAKMSPLAASGYRDTSRLASGNPTLNAHICATNKGAILFWLDTFSKNLRIYRELIATESEELEKTLAHARMAREEWLNSRK
jgi:prephenate dehydrogenase